MGAFRHYLPYLLPWWLIVPTVTWTAYALRVDSDETRARFELSDKLESATHVLGNDIRRLQQDVRLVARVAGSALAQRGAGAGNDVLAGFLRDFLSAHPRYTQARLLDETCMERLRLDHGPSAPVRIPEDQLQDKSDRYYCTETLKLARHQAYLSALDLNIEHGQVVEPYEPTLRIGTRVFLPDGRAAGLVVLNLDAGPILAAFTRQSTVDISLINDEGYWLAAPDPKDAFGFALGAPERRFSARHPDTWQAMQRQDASIGFSREAGELWVYRRIAPAVPETVMVAPTWYVVVHLNAAHVNGAHGSLALAHVLTGALALLAFSLLAMTVARGHVRQARTAVALGEANTRLTRSLEQLRDSLEQRVRSEKLASLGLLVAGVAHELNTPLGGAMLTCTTLEDQLHQLEAAFAAGLRQSDLTRHMDGNRDGLALLRTNLQRAAELITQFKAVASDRASAERSRFNLKVVVDGILTLMQGELKHAPVSVAVHIPEHIRLNSYPGPLGQIVQNLVHNALHHGYTPAQRGCIRIEAHQANDQVMLSVIDDGQGIGPEHRAQIWDPFFTTRRNAGGTGLGLHLCQQLAENVLGGHLELADDPPGGGTHMRLTLPIEAPGAAPADA